MGEIWYCLLLCPFILGIGSQATYTETMQHRAKWNEGRRLGTFHHYTCTMPIATPVDHFSVKLTVSALLHTVKVWSLDLYKESNIDGSFIYQSKRTMYPPRIVLNFHLHVIGPAPALNSSCEWNILPARLPPVPPTIMTRPGLRLPPPRLPRALAPGQGGQSGIITNGLILPDDACILMDIFFDSVASFPPTDDGTTTEPIPATFPNEAPPILRPMPPFLGQTRKKRGLTIPIENSYISAIEKSMYFYTAQRSGSAEIYDMDSPVQWVRPSGMNHIAPDGTNLTGGWFDGNDVSKINLPMASSVTLLAWGLHLWPMAYRQPVMQTQIVETLKWPLEYFLKCWNNDTQTLYVQVGNLDEDRNIWERADSPMYDKLVTDNKWSFYKATPQYPASDVAGEMASALVMSSMALGGLNRADISEPFNLKLFETAIELYDFGSRYQGVFSDIVVQQTDATYPIYISSGYKDELCLAAVLIYGVNYNERYLEDAQRYFQDAVDPTELFSWDNKYPACATLLYLHTADTQYQTYVTEFLRSWINGNYTSGHLAYRSEEAPLRYAANAALVALIANEYELIEDASLLNKARMFSIEQINYILGQNPAQKSYLIGFGDNYSKKPYHKTSCCPSPPENCGWGYYHYTNLQNQNVLVGALVGGPDRNDQHIDSRKERVRNSVALDHNAGFQSALAGLYHLESQLFQECREIDPITEFLDTTYSSSPYTTHESTTEDYTSTTERTTTTTKSTTTQTTKFTTTQSTAVPARPTSINYADALGKSILFYEAQRDEPFPSNYRVPWRRNTTSNIRPFVLGGGWFDDGSAVKTTIAMASSVSLLAWGGITFKEGYQMADELDNLYDTLRCPLQYFLDMWNDYPSSLRVKSRSSEGKIRAFWARPGDYVLSDLPMKTDEFGTDIAADVATAMAIGARLFADKDSAFSSRLLVTSEAVYNYATSLNGNYNDTKSLYYSGNADDSDELCLSAAWLRLVTNNDTYLDAAKTYNQKLYKKELSWSNKHVLCELMLYEFTGHAKYRSAVQSFVDHWRGSGVQKTPQGLSWNGEIGPLRYAANSAFVALLAAKAEIGGAPDEVWAKSQIDYILGMNDKAYSYLIGYGNRFPRRPHHRSSSCPDYMEKCDWSIYNAPWANPHLLTGALVSGPDINDFFEDARTNYTMNRVAIDYNAGFQSALAGLIQIYGKVSMETSTQTTTTTPKTTTSKQKTTTTADKPTEKVTTSKTKPETLPPNVDDKRTTFNPLVPDSSGQLEGTSKGTIITHSWFTLFLLLLFAFLA